MPDNGHTGDCLVCENCGTDLAPIHRLRDLAVFHYNAALALVDHGDDAASIRELYAALATAPSWLAVRVLLGKLLWKSGRKEEAKAEWCLAAQENPDDATVNALLDATKQTPSRRFPTLGTVSAAIAIAFVSFFAGIMTVDTRQMDAPSRSDLPIEKSVTSNHDVKRDQQPSSLVQTEPENLSPIPVVEPGSNITWVILMFTVFELTWLKYHILVMAFG